MPYNFNLPERLWLSFWRKERAEEEPLGFQFRHEESPLPLPTLYRPGYRNAGQEGLLECTQSWRTLRINIYNLDSGPTKGLQDPCLKILSDSRRLLPAKFNPGPSNGRLNYYIGKNYLPPRQVSPFVANEEICTVQAGEGNG